MFEETITSDNLQLSEAKIPIFSSKNSGRAINCPGNHSDGTSQFFVQNSIAESSRRAYLSDLREFEKAGFSVPGTPETVAQYLAESACSLAVATLVRRLASLSCRAPWKTAPSASRGIAPSSDTEERVNEAGTNH